MKATAERTTKPIHTLDARDNVMLEVMRDYFNLDPRRMYYEIQGMREMVEGTLRQKGVNYDELRSALVPSQDRREIALVFDSTAVESHWYGFLSSRGRVVTVFY
jgi:hypothetical protein